MDSPAQHTDAPRRDRASFASVALLVPALATILLHLLTTTGYGLSGEELYAVACSEHPAAGYVDLGPLPVLLLALQRLIGGDALLTIRCVSAVIAALTVFFTGRIARQMGAGPFGQFLAALCALIAPALLFAGHVATSFGFAVLTWTLGTSIVVSIVSESKPLKWILLGALVGLGTLSSFITVLFVVALLFGVLMTPLRKHLGTIWPWAGAAAALVIVLPWIIWQAAHGWPTLAWVRASYEATLIPAPCTFVLEQVKQRHPFTLPVWLTGVIALLFFASHRPWRVIAWMYIAAAIMMYATHVEPHYLIAAVTGLFAAGAVVVEKWLRKGWLRVAIVVILVAGGIATLPMGIPVLGPRTFITYEKAMHFRLAMGDEHATDRLPGYYGTMFGRRELAVVMNAVFSTLPPDDRPRYGILCEDAVQAAALNFYGKEFSLPRAVSGDGPFWEWGPGNTMGDKLVVVGGNAAGLQGLFNDVSLRMRFRDEYLHPGNGMTPVWLVGRPAAPLTDVWEKLRTMR